jgi:hypothetical protein
MNNGKKFDGDKARFDLIPLLAMEGAAKVMGFGAKKYGEWNWLAVDNAEARYTAAMLRHLALHQAGELRDHESGLKHIDHILCNALFLAALNKDK